MASADQGRDDLKAYEAKIAAARANSCRPAGLAKSTSTRKAKEGKMRRLVKGNGGDEPWTIRCKTENRERVKAMAQAGEGSISDLMDEAMELLFAKRGGGGNGNVRGRMTWWYQVLCERRGDRARPYSSPAMRFRALTNTSSLTRANSTTSSSACVARLLRPLRPCCCRSRRRPGAGSWWPSSPWP